MAAQAAQPARAGNTETVVDFTDYYLSVHAHDADLNALLAEITTKSGVNVVLDTPVDRKVTVDFDKKGFTQGMKLIVAALGETEFTGTFELAERFTGSTYRIHKLAEEELAAKRSRAAELNARGAALLADGKDYQAVPFFAAAIHEDPKMAAVYKNAARAFDLWGDREKKVDALEKLVAVEPDNGENYKLLGDAYWEDFRYEKAAEAYSRSVSQPARARAAAVTAKIHRRIDAAAEPDYRGIAQLRSVLEQREVAKAIDLVGQIESALDAHPEAYELAARAHELAGKLEDAVSWHKRYAEHFPTDVPNLIILARELRMLSRGEEAQEYLAEAKAAVRSEYLSVMVEQALGGPK